MIPFYATFGTGHEYAGCYVKIYADSHHSARCFMIKAHGRRWCAVYDAYQFADQAERYSLMRLATVRQRPTHPNDTPYFDVDREAAQR